MEMFLDEHRLLQQEFVVYFQAHSCLERVQAELVEEQTSNWSYSRPTTGNNFDWDCTFKTILLVM